MRSLIATTIVTLATIAGTGAQAQPAGLTGSLSSSVKFVDARVDEVLSTLARLAGVTLEFDATVTEEDRARRVGHITLVRSSFADAFAFVSKYSGLTYTLVDNKTVRIARQ